MARCGPFVLFVLLTAAQGHLGEGSRYWIYAVKTLLGLYLLFAVRRLIPEMQVRWSPAALVAGIVGFLVWVGLDPFYPRIGFESRPWAPFSFFGHDSLTAMVLVGIRFFGSTIVVPPLEEVFYRSFLYRSLIQREFLCISLNSFQLFPFLVTSAVFGLAHVEWLPGILCGMVFQALVCSKGNLGEAIFAHGVTNLLLGSWVVVKEAWHFW